MFSGCSLCLGRHTMFVLSSSQNFRLSSSCGKHWPSNSNIVTENDVVRFWKIHNRLWWPSANSDIYLFPLKIVTGRIKMAYSICAGQDCDKLGVHGFACPLNKLVLSVCCWADSRKLQRCLWLLVCLLYEVSPQSFTVKENIQQHRFCLSHWGEPVRGLLLCSVLLLGYDFGILLANRNLAFVIYWECVFYWVWFLRS